jgi:hypothetical protein
MNMVTIGTANIILAGTHCLDNTCRYSFLPVIQVDEAEHFAPVVHFGALVFKEAPQYHIFIEP